MGRKPLDLTGFRTGRLTVLRSDGMIGRASASLVRCDCGIEKRMSNSSLKSGAIVSCGCYNRERASKQLREHPTRLVHGQSGTITYTCWISMIHRCYEPNNMNYKRYGAKGIAVCDRWKDPDNGYLNFLSDMGPRPSLAYIIDRKESAGNYEPDNCRWATRAEQNQNVPMKVCNTTGYKGITKTSRNRWMTTIRANGVRYTVGVYATKEQAALAYNLASLRLHGDFGVRNELPVMTREETIRVTKRVNERLNRSKTGDK